MRHARDPARSVTERMIATDHLGAFTLSFSISLLTYGTYIGIVDNRSAMNNQFHLDILIMPQSQEKKKNRTLHVKKILG